MTNLPAQALYENGMTLLERGYYLDAKVCLDRACALEPGNPLYQAGKERIFVNAFRFWKRAKEKQGGEEDAPGEKENCPFCCECLCECGGEVCIECLCESCDGV